MAQASRSTDATEFRCLICDASWCNIVPYNLGGRKTSCSDACRRRLSDRRAKARYAKVGKAASRPCPKCGEEFQPTTNHPRYTCRSCSGYHRSKPAGTVLGFRDCRWCGKTFELTNATDDRKVSCSKQCTDFFNRWRSGYASCPVPQPKPQPKSESPRPRSRGRKVYICRCEWCGRSFIAAKSAKGCSHFCRRARSGAKTDLRRVVCSGCGDEFVTGWSNATWCSPGCRKARGKFPVGPRRREKLYVRDGWKCQICFEVVDLGDCSFVVGKDGAKHFAAGPLYPSLDHIVPQSKGGGHESSNLRTAHMKCNRERGAEWQPEQLSLRVA